MPKVWDSGKEMSGAYKNVRWLYPASPVGGISSCRIQQERRNEMVVYVGDDGAGIVPGFTNFGRGFGPIDAQGDGARLRQVARFRGLVSGQAIGRWHGAGKAGGRCDDR